MRWLSIGGRRRQAMQHLARAAQELENESEREEYVDRLVERIEEAQRRNHFGESIERAMGRKKGWT